MSNKLWRALAGLCVFAMSAVWVLPVCAQTSDSKEKPPMYSYVAFWNIPQPRRSGRKWTSQMPLTRSLWMQGHRQRQHCGLRRRPEI